MLALLALLPAGISAALSRSRSKRRLEGQARYTDTFSLLKKLNSNPYAFNQAFSAAPVSLSQQQKGGAKQAGGDVAGLGALLGTTESVATVGSDAAADAVTDSIKDLFDLDDKPAKASDASAPKAPAVAKTAAAPSAPKPKATPASKLEVTKSKTVAKVPAAASAPKPKAPPASKPEVAKTKTGAKSPAAPSASKPKAPTATKPAVLKSKKVAKIPAAPSAKKTQASKAMPAAKAMVPKAPPKAPPAPKAATKASPKAAPKAPVMPKALLQSQPPKAPPMPVTKPQPAKAPQAPKPVVRKAPVTVPAAKPKAKPATITAAAQKVAAVKPPAIKQKTTVAKASAAPSPKPAPKKVVAMVVSKIDEKTAAMTREAQLEAEISALKGKLAQTATPPPKTPQVVKVAPAKKEAVAKAVIEPAPVVEKAVAKTAPVVKTNPQAKPVVKEAAQVKPAVEKASSSLAMASVSSGLAGKSVNSARAVEESDELVGNFEAPATSASAAPVVKDLVAVVAPASKLEPAKVAAKETPTAAPAPEELTMTMVPEASAVHKVEQAVSTEPIRGSSLFGSIGHFFHRIFLGADPVVAPVAPTQAPVEDPNAGRPAFSRQDIERTATSAADDGLSSVSIADDFKRKEAEDISLIDRVKREDRALRIDAETPQKPAMPAPAAFVHDKGSTHISSFWGALEEEDGDIEQALTENGDDLTEYERLRKLQDERVQSSVSEISGPHGQHLALERRALRKAASAA